VSHAGSAGKPEPGPVSRTERLFRARTDRAAVLHTFGVIERIRNHHQEARAALDEARVLCEQLLTERPRDTALSAILVDTQKALVP
jgi:hypothetical protein